MNKEAMLYKKLPNKKVSCFLCHHKCQIKESEFGICGVRENRKGTLYSNSYGRIIAAHVDPIEKKPLYHFLPGTVSFSIATAGCNFSCPFCQNWQISQSTKKGYMDNSSQFFLPEDIVSSAKKNGCRSISYTYTEPTVFFELAYDTAKLASKEGIKNNFVTNGYMTPEAIKTIEPYLDACNVDLKSFRDEFYKKVCKARLQPVLDSIRLMKELGIWVEITTLVIPGENDSEEELQGIVNFISEVDVDIPWHISRFHPDYKYTNTSPTPISTLKKAYELGKENGLNYIYIGNVVNESQDTHCPSCGKVIIKRGGFYIADSRLKDSSCPFCGDTVAGVFE